MFEELDVELAKRADLKLKSIKEQNQEAWLVLSRARLVVSQESRLNRLNRFIVEHSESELIRLALEVERTSTPETNWDAMMKAFNFEPTFVERALGKIGSELAKRDKNIQRARKVNRMMARLSGDAEYAEISKDERFRSFIDYLNPEEYKNFHIKTGEKFESDRASVIATLKSALNLKSDETIKRHMQENGLL